MIDDVYDIKTTDYLPYISLVKGPDYQKLFNSSKGIDLYKSLKKKFGVYEFKPYSTPREDEK